MITTLRVRAAKSAAGVTFFALAVSANAGAPPVPGDVPRRAAEAMALAHKWRPDAALVAIQTRQAGQSRILGFLSTALCWNAAVNGASPPKLS